MLANLVSLMAKDTKTGHGTAVTSRLLSPKLRLEILTCFYLMIGNPLEEGIGDADHGLRLKTWIASVGFSQLERMRTQLSRPLCLPGWTDTGLLWHWTDWTRGA